MSRLWSRWGALAALLAIGCGAPFVTIAAPAVAPGAAPVLGGALAHPGPLDAAALAKLPQISLPVAYGTGHGVTSGRYAGVLLWDLLQQAGPTDQPGKHASLRHTLLVVGQDGYAVAFSFGELSPGGTADPVLLVADAGGWNLVVPGDRTGARDVHQVARISVQ